MRVDEKELKERVIVFIGSSIYLSIVLTLMITKNFGFVMTIIGVILILIALYFNIPSACYVVGYLNMYHHY